MIIVLGVVQHDRSGNGHHGDHHAPARLGTKHGWTNPDPPQRLGDRSPSQQGARPARPAVPDASRRPYGDPCGSAGRSSQAIRAAGPLPRKRSCSARIPSRPGFGRAAQGDIPFALQARRCKPMRGSANGGLGRPAEVDVEHEVVVLTASRDDVEIGLIVVAENRPACCCLRRGHERVVGRRLGNFGRASDVRSTRSAKRETCSTSASCQNGNKPF